MGAVSFNSAPFVRLHDEYKTFYERQKTKNRPFCLRMDDKSTVPMQVYNPFVFPNCSQMRICDSENMPKSYEKPGNHEDFRVFTGTPKGTRTPDLLIRSQSLYPTELSAHRRSTKRLSILAHDVKKSKYFFKKIQLFF